jgi:hypothetical protein
MRSSIVSGSKRCLLALSIMLVITTTLFGQQRPGMVMSFKDQSVHLSDDHKHSWDDLRMLLVTLTEVNDGEIRWKHQTSIETKTGLWQIGRNLRNSNSGLKSERIKSGKEFIAVYCSHCETAIWLYDSE